MTFSTRIKLFLSHFLAIILVSGSIGSYFYTSAIDNLMGSVQTRLRYSAALLSKAIDATVLDQLVAAGDMNSPQYQQALRQLRSMVASNDDIAYIYVMRLDGEQVRFVLDSDVSTPAALNEVYKVDAPSLISGFDMPSCVRELIHDKWGTFMSGYAPIQGGAHRYAIGIDMRAEEVERKLTLLQNSGVVSLVFSLLLAGIFSHWLSRSFLKRINALHERCLEISHMQGVPPPSRGDELDQLSTTFDHMLIELHRSQLELEERVATRTTELQQANEQLQAEVAERTRIAKLLEATARTDFLTQLINRRAMAQRLHEELTRTERTAGSFSVVLVDIDNFKVINDEFGHDVGDEVLKALSRAFATSVREHDIVARWGGEEFLILLPDTEQGPAAEQAERLRLFLDGDNLHIPRYPHRVTASFGVSQHRPGDSMETLLKQADIALYEAKAQGRNRVRCSVVTDELTPPDSP